MSDTLDHLEVAKLATFIGSQLKTVDSQTEGMLTPASRLDTGQFIRNVVNSANPNAYRQPQHYGGNQDEAKLLEMLNAQAMQQVPDVTQHNNVQHNVPDLIPLPDAPTVDITPTDQYISNVVEPKTNHPILTISSPDLNPVDHMLEISLTLKSIDANIKTLCDVLIKQNAKKKPKPKTPTKPKPKNNPNLITIHQPNV